MQLTIPVGTCSFPYLSVHIKLTITSKHVHVQVLLPVCAHAAYPYKGIQLPLSTCAHEAYHTSKHMHIQLPFPACAHAAYHYQQACAHTASLTRAHAAYPYKHIQLPLPACTIAAYQHVHITDFTACTNADCPITVCGIYLSCLHTLRLHFKNVHIQHSLTCLCTYAAYHYEMECIYRITL